MNYSDPNQAEWALRDPATSGEALAAIAQAHPALRDRVVTHPNAYPQLVAWVAAQSTAGGVSAPPQSAGPSYGPAAPQPYGPAQPYTAQPYTAQPYPAQPSAPEQPYYGPGGYPAGPPAKKTGLVLGLVGGGVFVVALVVVLGLFVFHWFGSSGSGPILTKKQVEAFLDSDFMEEVSGGLSADDYSHDHYSASDLEDDDLHPSCQGAVDMLIDGDNWSSWSSTVEVQRLAKRVSPRSVFDAQVRCEESDTSAEDLESISINEQDGGWWVSEDGDSDVAFVYGNVWLDLPAGEDDDETRELFKDFVAAIDAVK